MCGRFSQSFSSADIKKRFHVDMSSFDLHISYNIAPSQQVTALINNGERRPVAFRWGLIPHWAKDEKIGYRMINSRAETVADKLSFKSSLMKRRCIIIADGFYEWRHEGDKKLPWYISLKDHRLFGFAGLYDRWTSPDGDVIDSCTIITTNSNDLIKPIHDRMPVIIPEEKENIWLDPDMRDTDEVCKLLKPYPATEMECYEVSTLVNSPKNDSPDCILPIK